MWLAVNGVLLIKLIDAPTAKVSDMDIPRVTKRNHVQCSENVGFNSFKAMVLAPIDIFDPSLTCGVDDVGGRNVIQNPVPISTLPILGDADCILGESSAIFQPYFAHSEFLPLLCENGLDLAADKAVT